MKSVPWYNMLQFIEGLADTEVVSETQSYNLLGHELSWGNGRLVWGSGFSLPPWKFFFHKCWSCEIVYNHSWNIWGWLWFLRGMGHCGKILICVFQRVFASISGIFALAGGIGHWAIILLGLDTFLIFLKPSVVRQLVRQLVHTMFISNDHTSFHLW